MTHSTGTIACPQCSTKIELFHRPIIDASRFERFLSKPLNPSSCPGCGLTIDAATPCVVIRDEWIGIVLANPAPIDIAKAAEVIDYFLQQLPGQWDGKHLLVAGREEQLRRILRRLPNERFSAVSFPCFLCREWESHIEQMKVAVDSCLAAGRAELAYWWLIGAVGLFNELYLHPTMRECLEMAVLAAGDRIAPGLKEPRTAGEDFDRVQKMFEPMVPSTPSWFNNAYLCFYEDDSYFEGHPANFASELCRLSATGGVDFSRAELHLTLGAPQAITRAPLRPVEKALAEMYALLTIGELSRLGIEIGESDRTSVADLDQIFRTSWDDLLNSTDRYQVYKEYQRLTGGKDIRFEWGLPSHGLTFTIDRMESGEDPRSE